MELNHIVHEYYTPKCLQSQEESQRIKSIVQKDRSPSEKIHI